MLLYWGLLSESPCRVAHEQAGRMSVQPYQLGSEGIASAGCIPPQAQAHSKVAGRHGWLNALLLLPSLGPVPTTASMEHTCILDLMVSMGNIDPHRPKPAMMPASMTCTEDSGSRRHQPPVGQLLRLG